MAMALPLVLGSSLVATAAPAEAAYVPTVATVAAYEARVIYAMNVQRARYHQVKLVANWCPDWYAEYWGAYLARTGLFYHRPLAPILSRCHASRASENLARGYTTADATVAAWMASPGHRANVLDSTLRSVGVAAVYANGRWTVVANFTRP